MLRQTLSLRETARLLGWSEAKLWRKRREGTLPEELTPLKCRPGEAVLFPVAGVEQYLGHPIDMAAIDFEKLAPPLPTDEAI